MPTKGIQLTKPQASIQESLRRFKAGVFQALAHPTRIHIAEILREGEHSVGSILRQLQVEPANLSQHLAVLRSKRLVLTRREANVIYYRLRDPLLVEVLDIMRKHFHSHLEESLKMLREIEREG